MGLTSSNDIISAPAALSARADGSKLAVHSSTEKTAVSLVWDPIIAMERGGKFQIFFVFPTQNEKIMALITVFRRRM